jgi:hypothetical protein
MDNIYYIERWSEQSINHIIQAVLIIVFKHHDFYVLLENLYHTNCLRSGTALDQHCIDDMATCLKF